MRKPKGLPLQAFAIFLLAAVIGVAGGALGTGFQKGLDWIQATVTGTPELLVREPDGTRGKTLSAAVSTLSWWHILLVPTGGGLAAGLVLLLLRNKKAPFGLADLVVLVQLRKGAIRLRESFVQIVSSACTIGSGGSIGREGANSQIAATVAALLARWSHVASRSRAVLIGCGVAAGMATSYNAPIAGAIFVMEIVLGNFAMDVFAPVVLASVLSVMVRNDLFGEGLWEPIYKQSSGLVEFLPWYLVLAAVVLGLLCGVGGILFRASLATGRRLFSAMKMPVPVRMAIAGLIVGLIGLFMPQAWGNGFEVVEELAHGTEALGVVLTLFAWKLVATTATVGSGGLGGIFTPNLVVGAAFGALFAWCLGGVVEIGPKETATFVFVGMAGLTAATMHAPVTSVMLVFELTGHYELTLPVMLCAIVASITATLLDEDSYYTAAIKAKGEEIPSGLEDLAIRSTYVRDVMRSDVLTVKDTARFPDVMGLLSNHRGDTIYVQDPQGGLVGRIELQDVKSFLNDPTLTSAIIAGDLTRPVVTVHPEQSIANVMKLFDDPELREAAVTAPGSPVRLVGRIRHQDVLTMLGSQVLGQNLRNRRVAIGGDELELPPGYELRTIPVPDAWIGHAVDGLPSGNEHRLVLLMAIRPGNEVVAATADVVLQPGWSIVVLGTRDAVRNVQRQQDGSPDEE